MRTLRTSSYIVGSWTVVLAITVAACNRPNPEADADDRAPAAATADGGDSAEKGPMTLVGCLQQGDGRGDFILTQVNAQPGPVATTGGNESTAVQQKQQEAAARSYRLSGGPDNLRDLVGHQVRVTGTVSERGDVLSGDRNRDVKEGDLAELDVTTAESVANTCVAASGDRERPQQ